jgi:gliding motility-associated-like protein
MFMKSYKYILVLLVSMYAMYTSAQIYKLDFKSCELTLPIGVATTNGSPVCGCGVIDESMSFDGIDDGVILPDTLIKFLQEDFTIDFYLQVKNTGVEQVDIFSVGNDCGIDSLITMKYVPSSKELLVELFINNGVYFPIKSNFDINNCWNRVTLVKSKLNYILYINNEVTETAIATQNIPLPKYAKMALSNSPCLIVTDQRLEGRIDEFNIHSRALAERELFQSYLFPERILSNDTTVFAGASVDLEFGNTCASTFVWTPSTTLDQDDIANVVATPDVTTTYKVTATSNDCISKDEVTVFVLDPDKQNCDNLLLPNAFTPNDDRVNDIFKISNPFIIETLQSFEVIDRWGEVLYKSSEKNDGWDGYYLAKRAEPGMYVYRVSYTCKNEKYNKLGNFVLIK